MDKKARDILIEGKGANFVENGIKKALTQIGTLIVKETQKGIKNPPKSGRTYGSHRASKAGEYPANKTGNLRRSVNFEVKNKNKMVVGATADYAVFLEEGTSKIDPRKLFEFTIRKQRDKIRDIVRKNVYSEVK